jgi:cytochrome c biogenesis protein CcmG, thiol:disulfide interchange protein DsbE
MPTSNLNDRRWMILFLVAASCLVATRWHFSHQSAGVEPVAQRKPAPDMTLPQLGGGQWKLADHRGQVVLINYWATWCEPCRDELPGLLQVARDSAPKGLAVVGVSFDSGREPARTQAVQSFVTQFRVPWPIAFPDATLDRQSGDIGLPTSILIDRQGRAAKTYLGEVDRATLAKDVAALLGES